MSETNSRRNGTKTPGGYFFLSYAHFPPLAGSLEEHQPDPPDEWVRTFFRDLTKAVQVNASPPPPPMPGFFDQAIPLGSDWKAELSRALGTAEVFVPLLSPDYLTKSWPGREWACFEKRMKSSGVGEPLRRFAPVLWIPLPANQHPEGLDEALDLAPPDAAKAYRENGLRALLRLTPYKHWYEMIVSRLATRVIDLAENNERTGPSVADIDQVPEGKFTGDANLPSFAIVVVAPSSPGLPAGADSTAYGHAARTWRPFARDQQELSLAEYAQVVAEQLDFAVEVVDVEKARDGDFSGKPAVVLIDPWYIADAEGRDIFGEVAAKLEPWTLPVLITAAYKRTAPWAGRVRAVLESANISRSEPTRRGLEGVGSMKEFFDLMPFLVTQAEREYLRRGPIQRPARSAGSRVGLGDRGEDLGPTSSQPQQEDPVEEGPAEEKS
jgi:FxsC-like protein